MMTTNSNLFWAVFGAVLSTLLSWMLQRYEAGKKRIIFEKRENIIVLKNNWKKTIKEDDFSKNDCLTIHLSKADIETINNQLESDSKKNAQGFRFDEDGSLHFQYWGAAEILYLMIAAEINGRK